MKKFRFRLATLERVRLRKRQATEGRLAEAVQQSSKVHEALKLREGTLSAFDAATPAMPSDGSAELPTGKDWKRWADLRDLQRAAVRRERAAADAAEERLEAVSQEYRNASRDHRLMTRLREKRHRRWKQEAEAEETRFLSEIHLQRLAGRRRDEAGD